MVRVSSTLSEVWVPQSSGIAVSVIYSDLHLMQIRMRASNRFFAAEVDTYLTHDACAKVGDQLKGFPLSSDDVRRVEIGPKIILSFSTLDSLGHSIVSVDMEADIPEQNGLTPRSTFSILVNPAQIDQFATDLSVLGPEIGESASLVGT